jgi:predicted O-methyltransferase YrrM
MTTLAALKLYARHPTIGLRRVGYKLYELTHPNEPWIAQGAIRFCETSLTREMVGFEWGSGRSTAWFAQRLGSLTSIEHDPKWFKVVQEKLKRRRIHNVTYRLIPANHPPDEPHRPFYDPLPDYVAAVEEFQDGTLDFACVDGGYRMACIWAVIPKLKPGGLLLVDNTDWTTVAWDESVPSNYKGVPSNWEVVHQSRNVMTQTTIWRKPQA